MHSENIAAYVGLDVHNETLTVAIAAPERPGEIRYYGTINNEAQSVRRLFQKLHGLYGKRQYIQLVEYIFFDEYPDDLFMS